MKIDRNSLLRGAPNGVETKRPEEGFKIALSRAVRDTPSLSSATRINRPNRPFCLAGGSSQALAPRASHSRSENCVAINANANGGNSGTDLWYRVRNGDTLSGVVKNRLKALDQTATPQAIAQFTHAIAQLNQISNPDRIFPEQKINLGFLENAKSSIIEAAPVPSPLSAIAPSAEPTTHQTLDFNKATQIETAQDVISPLFAGPEFRFQDGNSGQRADNRDLINAYSPDQMPDNPYASPAIEKYFDDPHGNSTSPPSPDISIPKEKSSALPDILYKGVIGKALDALPINPGTRTTLQQTNAIVSGSMAGRSLATIIGLASPIFAVAGLIWGIFSAKNIGAAASDSDAVTSDTPPARNIAANEKLNTPGISSQSGED